jgi:hypothetical protein
MEMLMQECNKTQNNIYYKMSLVSVWFLYVFTNLPGKKIPSWYNTQLQIYRTNTVYWKQE